MAATRDWMQNAVPTGWDDVVVRAIKVALIAFLTLVLKEWFETREFDLRACLIDGAWVAAGIFAVDAVLRGLAGARR